MREWERRREREGIRREYGRGKGEGMGDRVRDGEYGKRKIFERRDGGMGRKRER